ncbi:carotenoid oxygenase family protein [Streptomyces sp. SID3343]|uniref:carotenoid oxygenase family protein n=1 Tax=Streptomyces sp. SID3343 TaxID=2690260 RepID=UPI00136CEA46|nr:carotenoid oxygenase family protein [Streptomyces sp. SID3343]MYW04559.1 9-cis-epoxycarotenoid dioxygenase [Streptomyces sp. SID3343]
MTPFHLTGNHAPVADERTDTDLRVTGVLPPQLTGSYLRNGPNPRKPSGHWFLGDGMVHGVHLDAGRARWYRNRFVRTASFDTGAPVHRPDGSRDLANGAANTHVVRHAGRTLALVESSLPYELTDTLDTIGPHDFAGRLRTSMTAHPKTCPDTGELHFFGCGSIVAPYLTYHRADASGELVVTRDIEVSGSTMMHDFNLTAGHVVFMDLPVVFDLDRARAGTMPYAWQESYGARLGVLRRDDPHGAVRWFEIDPCYVFHTLNAHDEGTDRIVLHVMRRTHLYKEGAPDSPATLWRWTIDLAAETVREEQLDDRPAEFPRIDDRHAGLPAQHGYAATEHALLRYDLSDGAVVAHEFGAGRTPGEASFVPADDRPGGPGWLLTYVYDAARDTSDLVVLDADDLAAEPVATVHLPCRVPFGFHGNWLTEVKSEPASEPKSALASEPEPVSVTDG